MTWQAMTVTSGWELKTTERILSAGFVAHCPVYEKKYRARRRGPIYFVDPKTPLFSGYIFIVPEAAFRKEKFETTRVWLSRVRGGLISEDEMKKINLLALDLSRAQSQSVEPLRIKRHEILQVIHGITAGDRVKVLEALRDKVKVQFLDKPEWNDAWINRTALGKAV